MAEILSSNKPVSLPQTPQQDQKPSNVQQTAEDTQAKTPQNLTLSKEKQLLVVAFIGILLVLLAGVFFIEIRNQKLRDQQAIQTLQQLNKEKESQITEEGLKPISESSFSLDGIDYTIDEAFRMDDVKIPQNNLLVIRLTMAASDECSLNSKTTCGYNPNRFKLTDTDGFLYEQSNVIPEDQISLNPLTSKTLKPGEKDKGDLSFLIPKESQTFADSSSLGASLSPSKTVTASFSFGIFKIFVRNSSEYSIASFFQ